MRKSTLSAVVIIALILFVSCSRGITTYEAANGKAKCGRHVR